MRGPAPWRSALLAGGIAGAITLAIVLFSWHYEGRLDPRLMWVPALGFVLFEAFVYSQHARSERKLKRE